jgi:putative hydrolase of the HAD superfamily
MARFNAILFDLFGTLVNFNFQEFDACVHQIACLLDAPPNAFARLLEQRYQPLETGAVTLDGYLAAAALDATGSPADPYRLGIAVDRWRAFQDTQLRPWADAEPALRQARSAGLLLGLVSNAPPPVHQLWPGSPMGGLFDHVVFSNVFGARKPHPSIYAHAAAGLGVPPERCVFVGDGSSGELAGASAAGMHAVRIRRPAEPPEHDTRFGREVWNGPSIASLYLLYNVLAGE